jgi:hypothetical protein
LAASRRVDWEVRANQRNETFIERTAHGDRPDGQTPVRNALPEVRPCQQGTGPLNR